MLNSKGFSESLYLNPIVTGPSSVRMLLILSICDFVFLFNSSTILTITSGMPSLIILVTLCYLTLSNTLVKSTNYIKTGLLNSIDFSTIWRMMKIVSAVDLFCLKPFCSLHNGKYGVLSDAIIIMKSFMTVQSSMISLWFSSCLLSPFLKIGMLLSQRYAASHYFFKQRRDMFNQIFSVFYELIMYFVQGFFWFLGFWWFFLLL